ncbi:hypothetical protein [Nonomuraea cavernae]|uniref:Uncharacterized protein n=1 Tax=Nonomuraea cavernae TaxID=2045107 RepID=A0A917YUJ4_9ACTN|nr:hypothetical protein [Nonomuraea cavernae]MCA2186960.1 hypothetical protein [Nonomuraea cavernae]GGO67060.1 hypothetical protein GCM10012289_22580 [Nonomuraea cavernae]
MTDTESSPQAHSAQEIEPTPDPDLSEAKEEVDDEASEDKPDEAQAEPQEPLLLQNSFQEAVGAAFVGARIGHVNLGEARKNVATRVLHPDVLQEMSDTYVRNDRNGDDKASEIERVLRQKRFVVITGDEGTGRFITSVNAILATQLHPVQILLDPDEIERSLIAKNGQGHLIDLGELEEETVRRLSKVLRDYVARIRSATSGLVIIATSKECRLLDPDDDSVVSIVGPRAESVFRSHLACATSRWYADQYAAYPKFKDALQGATPREATRLASLARKRADEKDCTSEETIEEVLAEFLERANAGVRDLFGSTSTDQSEYDRALVLAASALEGAQPDAVFSATEQLVELLELKKYPGRGSFGPGASRLLASIDAELVDGVVRFRRTDYALPVLDYVWGDQVYLRKHLDPWIISLGDKNGSDHIVSALLHLADSHNAPNLIVDAVTSWAGRYTSRARAVQLLDNAALSTEIGRSIRQSLYQWSVLSLTPEDIQVTVAEVCGGNLGNFFPGVALTRLRHLADRDSLRVKGTVCAALAALGKDDSLREIILKEVVDWTNSTSERQTTGALAFATLAKEHIEERFAFIPLPPADQDLIDILAQGWRATLRNSQTTAGASTLAMAWMEASVQMQASSEVITEIFATACRSSYDIGIIIPLARRWAHSSHEPSVLPREALYEELLARIEGLRPDLWNRSCRNTYEEM